jgi:hypothetical protein
MARYTASKLKIAGSSFVGPLTAPISREEPCNIKYSSTLLKKH